MTLHTFFFFDTLGFNAELQVTAQDLDFNDQDAYLQHRTPLEMYGFLIYWIISITEQKATSRAATMDKSGKAVVRSRFLFMHCYAAILIFCSLS